MMKLEYLLMGALAFGAVRCGGTDEEYRHPDAQIADAGPDILESQDGGTNQNDAGSDKGDAGVDAGYADSGPDAGVDAGYVDAGANMPPITNAGPDLNIQATPLSDCFNFSDNTDKIEAICGYNPRWAPGHGSNGTGSYDPDGNIKECWVLQDKRLPKIAERKTLAGKISLVYDTPGTYTLVVRNIDNQGAESTDEATVNVLP